MAESPVEASSIAVGALTLTGMIWATGYFAVLGVPMLPLLREPVDLLLIGVSVGLIPVMLFAAGAVFILQVAARITLAGNRDDAPISHMLEALKTSRLLRKPAHWWPFTALAFLLVFLLSVATGAAVRSGLIADHQHEVRLANGVRAQSSSLVGGIGRYAVLKLPDAQFMVIPADQIECIDDAPHRDDSPCGSTSTPEPPAHESTQVELVPIVIREQVWWDYAVGVLQCDVITSGNSQSSTPDAPLLFPAFPDDVSNSIDVDYYNRNPDKWPYGQDSTWQALRTNTKKPLTKAAEAVAVMHAVERIRALGDSVHSLNFIGFASGTNHPAHNQRLAIKRAEYVEHLVWNAMQCDQSCRDCPEFRHIGIGEMPAFRWAGLQGDVSRRTVLIAACERDLR